MEFIHLALLVWFSLVSFRSVQFSFNMLKNKIKKINRNMFILEKTKKQN